jgi:hypothetical protein
MPENASVSSTKDIAHSALPPNRGASRRGKDSGKTKNDALFSLADAVSKLADPNRPPLQHTHKAPAPRAAPLHNTDVNALMSQAIAAIEAAEQTDSAAGKKMHYRRAIRMVIQANLDPVDELPQEALEAGEDLLG